MGDAAAAQSAPQPTWSCLPLEVHRHIAGLLSPATLASCACMSRSWRALAADAPWAAHYAALWPAADTTSSTSGGELNAAAWQRRYAARQLQARCWLGRPAQDTLPGHSAAVKACCLVPELGLLFTGGVDRTVRAWDLGSGVLQAVSRRHGSTVRCLAADAGLLVSGASDHRIRAWHRSPDSFGYAETSCLPFDVAGGWQVLQGHAGPVSALALTLHLLASASWDCTVRLWDRRTLQCTALVQTDDWVYAVALRGSTLAAACSKHARVYSLGEGTQPRQVATLACPGQDASAAAGAILSLEMTEDGRNVFLGTRSGGVWLADGSRSGSGSSSTNSSQRTPVLLQQQAAEVACLSYEHPWLALGDLAGNVLLLHVGAATAAGTASLQGSCGGRSSGSSKAGLGKAASGASSKRRLVAASRLLFSGSQGGSGAATQCVALSGGWAAAGLDSGSVLSWDGEKGLQQQAAAAATRLQKAERWQRNQERQQQHRGSGRRSTAVPVPLVVQQEQQQRQGEQQAELQPLSAGPAALGRSPSGRAVARVPPPLAPGVPSSCRQQALTVLGSIRGGGGGGGDGGPSTGPASAAPAP